MTEATKYHRNDLIRSAEEMYPDCQASQAGNLRATLHSILIHVEVHDPKMFQEIIDFEMWCQERVRLWKIKTLFNS